MPYPIPLLLRRALLLIGFVISFENYSCCLSWRDGLIGGIGAGCSSPHATLIAAGRRDVKTTKGSKSQLRLCRVGGADTDTARDERTAIRVALRLCI